MREDTVKQTQYAQVLDSHLVTGFNCPLCSYHICFQREKGMLLFSSPIAVKSLYSYIFCRTTLHGL